MEDLETWMKPSGIITARPRRDQLMVEVREGAVRSEPEWMTKHTKYDESETFGMRWAGDVELKK